MVLQTSTLLNGLLKQVFTNKPADISKLQQSDILIREIFDLVEQNESRQFVVIEKILYKRVNDEFFILVVPKFWAERLFTNVIVRWDFTFP